MTAETAVRSVNANHPLLDLGAERWIQLSEKKREKIAPQPHNLLNLQRNHRDWVRLPRVALHLPQKVDHRCHCALGICRSRKMDLTHMARDFG